jgi:hypothetical protein
LSKEHLRQLYPALLQFKKRIIHIKLYNVEADPTVDPSVVEDKMLRFLEGKTLYVKICKFSSEDNVPEVEIYNAPNDKNTLTYGCLLESNYF